MEAGHCQIMCPNSASVGGLRGPAWHYLVFDWSGHDYVAPPDSVRIILPGVLSQCSFFQGSGGAGLVWDGAPWESACSLAQGVPTTPFNNPQAFILFCWNESWLWERCLSQFRFCRSDMCLVPCTHCTRLARSMASPFHGRFTVFMIHEICVQQADKTMSVLGTSEGEEICGCGGKDGGESGSGSLQRDCGLLCEGSVRYLRDWLVEGVNSQREKPPVGRPWRERTRQRGSAPVLTAVSRGTVRLEMSV